MGLISTQTGQKINLKKGYESRTISYQDWRKQQDQKRAAASQTVISAAAEAVRGKVGGMGVGSFAPSAAAAPQTSAGQSWDAGLTGQERREKQETVHRRLDALNRQALDPAVNQNPVRMNQLNQQMKALRASIGEQTVSDRVESGLGAAAASAGAGYANLAGLAAGTVHNADYNRRQIAAMQKALETGKLSDGKPVTAGIRKSLENSIAKMQKEAAAWESPSSFQSRAYRAADSAAERSAQLTAETKGGLGAVGQLAADVGVAGAQMGGDALIAALTGGTSLIPMAVRAAGGGAQEARQMGANSDQQWAYGLGSAALSVGTEKISNIAGPFKKMFGTGAAEKIAGKLVGRFGENQAVKLMTDLSKTAAGRIALSAIGEGSEEVVEDILQPFLKRATFDPNARFDAGEAGHDFLVGAILGGLGGVLEAVGSARAGTVQNQAETGTGADVRTPAGVETVSAESGVRGVKEIPTQQNAAPGTGTAVIADTSLFDRGVLNNFNFARKNLIEFARNHFPASVINTETGKTIGLSRKGLDKFLSGNITYDKYASGFHIPELIERAHKVGDANNYHPETAGSIPTFEYYDSPIQIDGKDYTAHIRVKNSLVGDKYYGHTVSEVEDIKIEPPTRTSSPETPAVQPENTGGSIGDTSATSANLTITQPSDSVKSRGDVMEHGVQEAPGAAQDVQAAPVQQNAAPGTGTAVNENGLTALTALERENLSSGKRNKVVSTFQEAVSFIRNALQNKGNTDRAYLGKIPDSVARMVQEQIGVDISGYNAILHSDNIRHIMKNHGDPMVEAARGQSPVTVEALAALPDVISSPDSVTISPNQDSRGRKILVFQKNIGGTYITMQAVADGTHSLQTDTVYIRKGKPTDTEYYDASAYTGPAHNAQSVPPSGIPGTNIYEIGEKVKASDPLMSAIFGAQKRVDQSTLSPEQFDRLADLNEKGTVGMDAAGKVYQVDPAEHIDRRSMGSVGERGVNAFQFDHPELHSYYVRAAEALIADADLSMQFPTVRRYEQGGRGRQVRQSAEVSAHLRQAMDETGLSRAQLIDAAKRIVEDHGQENAAAAKRVEIILDSMLENGWTAMTGKTVPPNQAYIDAKGRIAGSRAGEARESYIPPELDAVDESGTVGDDGLGAADAGSLNSDYDRLQAQSDTFHPEGAHAARPVDVPTRDFDGYNIPKSASTMMGAEILHDTNVRQLEQMVADGSLSFETIHDKDAVLYADRILRDKGFDAALEQYRNAARSNVATKGNVALGQLLMRQAAAAGNTDALAELFHLYASNSTTIAQAMQAQSLLRKLPPESQLVTVQKALDALNEKYGTDVQLEQADIKAFLEAGDQEAREAVRQKIVEKASQAVPGTFKAKFDAWRYLAMLGNPRTHIRNLTGNLFFQPLAATKNRVGALEEVLVNSISGKKAERTKSVTGAAPWGKLAKEARADWANAEEFLGRTSKYMEGQTSLWEIEQNADPFQQSGRVGKAVGWLADKNGRLLEAEDTLFKRWIYSQSLAGYLKANGVKSIADADPGLLNRARNYAAQEALRNTFNDKNAFSDAVAKLGGARNSSNPFIKAGGYLVEGVLPFKRTPANVLARGVEYSPIGAAASMVDLVHKGVTGQAAAETVAQGLDRLAAGLSGSALLAAGFLLGGAGYITGGEGDDRDQNAFDDLTGHQSYALETADGTSVTLDWLAPEAIPFFMGVELQRALLDRGMSLEDAWNVVKNTSEPMLEMSMLQGLNDMFESAAYARNKGGSVMGAVASSAFTNYFTQALPTLFGQLERTAEDRRMTTYTDSGSPLPRDVQYLLGKAGQKIPGWDYSQIPYVDAWGREEETGDALERAVKNLFSPAYTSQVQVDEVERELQRIKDATGDGGVFPDRAPRFFQADGNRKNLTAEEYLEYAKERGQESYRMVREGVGLPEYRSMTDQERAGFIADLYKYADQNARAGISDYEVDPWVKNARSAREDIGVSPAEYIALYRRYGSALLSGTGYDKTKQAVNAGLTVEQYVNLRNNLDADGNGSVSQAEAQAALDASSDLSRSQKADLWSIINKSWKKNPYR